MTIWMILKLIPHLIGTSLGLWGVLRNPQENERRAYLILLALFALGVIGIAHLSEDRDLLNSTLKGFYWAFIGLLVQRKRL